jgi:S1-C subfamily serine protease
VNSLDLLIVVAALGAALGGYRMGFIARVFSWLGMVGSVYLASRLLQPVLERLEEEGTPAQRLLIVLGSLLAAAFIGQAVGLVVGRKLHVALPFGGARQADRMAGSAAGVIGIFVTLWLLLPLMTDVRGWFAVQARTSTVAELVGEHLPDPPDTLATLRRFVGDYQFPQVFDALAPAPELGPPPEASGLTEELVGAVARSTVKVQGVACRRIQEGSGWVFADGLVVTNAHVVAGESSTVLLRSDGSEVEASVVAFDPNRDLAILRAPDLDRPALPRSTGEPGARGGVFGHPGGQDELRVAPFEVGRQVVATGTDIYDSARTERDVLVLAAALRPGDSGAALVDPDGEVVGVAFAIAPDKDGVAYALAMSEVDAVASGPLTDEVDTGPCLR